MCRLLYPLLEYEYSNLLCSPHHFTILKCCSMCRKLLPLLSHICLLVFSILQYWTLRAIFPPLESVYSNLLCTPHHFITCVFIILTLWRLLTPILSTELRACSILSDPTELFDRGLANILLGILSFWSSILLEASLLCVWLYHTHKTGSGAA